MKKRFTIGTALVAVLSAGMYLAVSPASAALTKPADHSLFDETSGDTSVFCRGTGPFNLYGSFRAINGDAVLRVTFQDGDFVDYPIPQDTSFSLQQVAGTTKNVDRKVEFTNAGTATGLLVGWVSASRLAGTGTRVGCRTL
jgi:hypothetical protein